MFRSASPPANGAVKLADATGPWGVDVQADPANTSPVFVAGTKADALLCLNGGNGDGTYPGLRLYAGVTVQVPGRDDNDLLKELWVSCAAASQWVVAQSF